jgi:photosystem II stability/assembly factor-like uncharacterized protein
MSNGFEKNLRDHLHREAARAKDLPMALPGRIRRGIDSGGRFTPIQQLALVGAMLVFVALVGFLVVQMKGTRASLPGQHNQSEQLPGFTCADRTGGQATSPSVPTEYRAAVHGGYERLTFQFNDAGVPAYRLEQRPTAQFLKDASGQPVTLKGSAGLMVVFRPLAAPSSPAASTEPGVYRSDLIGIASVMPANLTEVKEVALLGSFESVWTFGIGLANRSCFRVTELANPTRLAIDFDTSQTFACASQEGGAETGGPFQLKGIGVLPEESRTPAFDRLTLQFDSAVPPYAVIPQSSPTFSRYDGSAVTLLGSSGIRLKFGNVRNTDLSKISYSLVTVAGPGPDKSSPTDFTPKLAAIKEVELLDNSQSTIQYGIGLSSATCFRVIERDNPALLEIDFQTTPSVAKVPFQVRQLSFVDSLHGWALGTAAKGQITYLVLARTVDGGATWHYLPFQEPSIANAVGASWQIFFEDTQVGWLYGPNVYVSRDGGATWAPSPPSGPVGLGLPPLLALSASSDSVWAVTAVQQCTTATGVGSCPPHLLVSTDGGRGWTGATQQPVIAGTQAQIVRVSHDIGWILSWQPDRSSLAVTRDGGDTWQSLATPCVPETSLEDRMAALDDMRIWVVCGGQPGAGMQLKQLITSTDGGRHWTYQPNLPSSGYVQSLALSAPTSGPMGWLAMARGPLQASTDDGRTWRPTNLAGTQVGQAGSGVIEVTFTDALHGWAATSTEIFRTSDGGLHWTGVPVEALE